jgi:hypothetical protein
MGILIASSPRSGSSCLSGLVQLHGFSLGKDVATVKDTYNEKGYFENESILNFNRSALDQIGVNVFCEEKPTESQIEKSLDFNTHLEDVFDRQFSGELFSIKDPRIAILQDLYLKVSPSSKVILLRRNSEDSAKSMQRMRGFDLSKGMAVKAVYDALLDDMRDKADCLEMSFESVLSDPVASLGTFCEWAGVELQESVVLEFIERKLVHFNEGSDSNI